ncbi:MAG: chromate transporter [Thermodesulfovibrionales bacterium]|nr:chromate transporter [Thermodesulfovibrionales bacterium]
MFKFFFILFYINLFTIGGGYAMIPLLEKELVQKMQWLSHQEFLEAIAIGQMTPGPLTIMNAFIGYKLFGITGAIGAAVSTYLPSLIIVTLISYYYQGFRNSSVVNAVFKGIKPAVVGLLMATAITVANSSLTDFYTLFIAISAFILIAFTKIDPTFVILGAGLAGILIY